MDKQDKYDLKKLLKSFKLLNKINVSYKARRTKYRYIKWCKKYQTISILDKKSIDSWSETFKINISSPKRDFNYNVFYIGTNRNQDESGFIQALGSKVNLFRYHGDNDCFQLNFPSDSLTIEEARRANGAMILEEIDLLLKVNRIDFVIGQMWNYIVPFYILDVIKSRGIKIVNIAMDDRHSFHLSKLEDGTDGGVYGLINSVDLFATAAPECVKFYNYYKKRAIFLPEASNDTVFFPTDGVKDLDIVFIGSNYGFRKKVVDFLQNKGMAVHCFGSGWSNGTVSIKDSNTIFNRAKIILGIGGILHCDDFSALKLRDFDAPMSGSFYLTQYNPDLDILYSVGEDIVIWTDLSDLYHKCLYYLRNESERQKIAFKGYNSCKFRNTWDFRLDYLLNEMDKLS